MQSSLSLVLSLLLFGIKIAALVDCVSRDNAKFLQALFSEDTIKNKRNTEAIEVAPSTMISGRIVEYKPATVRPLAEVAPDWRHPVLRQTAAEMLAALSDPGRVQRVGELAPAP